MSDGGGNTSAVVVWDRTKVAIRVFACPTETASGKCLDSACGFDAEWSGHMHAGQ
jgi:hypothetical protein